MKEIRIEDIPAQGYRENPEGLILFQRQQFRPWPLLVLVVLAFVLIAEVVLGFAGGLEAIALAISGLLWATVFAVLIKGYLANPRSRHTGKPLMKFRNASPGRDSLLEVVYICPESKTYFIQVYPSDV